MVPTQTHLLVLRPSTPTPTLRSALAHAGWPCVSMSRLQPLHHRLELPTILLMGPLPHASPRTQPPITTSPSTRLRGHYMLRANTPTIRLQTVPMRCSPRHRRRRRQSTRPNRRRRLVPRATKTYAQRSVNSSYSGTKLTCYIGTRDCELARAPRTIRRREDAPLRS